MFLQKTDLETDVQTGHHVRIPCENEDNDQGDAHQSENAKLPVTQGERYGTDSSAEPLEETNLPKS